MHDMTSPQTTHAHDDLHASYVVAINSAIESGNDHRVPGLAASYDRAIGRVSVETSKPSLLDRFRRSAR